MLIPSKHSGYSRDAIRLYPKKSTSIPPPDPKLYEVMDKQVKQGDEMNAFIRQSYAENQVRQTEQDALNRTAIDQNMRLAQSAEDRSNDAYSFYKEKGRPVIEQSLKDASEWDSDSNIDRAQQAARTDAQLANDSAQQQNNRMLARMGVNPNSMKFAALNNAMQLQKAATSAGAVSQAGENRRLQGVSLRQQAGNLASGMPAQSMGFAGQASGMGGAAAGLGAAGNAQNMGMQNQMMSGLGQAGSQYGNASSNMNQLYNTTSANAQFSAKQSADSSAGLGQIAGMAAMAFMAEGGPVNGRGSGISDEIPAINKDSGQRIQLSNGEYVIPADVVRKVGEDKFDSLLRKYHVPAAVQRGNLGAR